MDTISYIMGMEDGYADGINQVNLDDGGEYTFTDPDDDGNVVVMKEGA